MKAYVITTGAIFGLVTVAHILRMLGPERQMATDPWYVALTVVTAAFCAWAFSLAWRSRPARA